MQLEMFDTAPQPGTYAPKTRTLLEALDLQPFCDAFKPLLPQPQPRLLLECPWEWIDDAGARWSAVTNQWSLLAMQGQNKDARILNTSIPGHAGLRRYIETWKAPLGPSRTTFSALCKWAGDAQWPGPCARCEGIGTLTCDCIGDNGRPFSDCQDCDEAGVMHCDSCSDGVALVPREQRLEKTLIDANLLACLLETLAPAVPAAQSVLMWRAEERGNPMVRFQSRDWLMIVMARASEVKETPS